jgi:hypothetical protein
VVQRLGFPPLLAHLTLEIRREYYGIFKENIKEINQLGYGVLPVVFNNASAF